MQMIYGVPGESQQTSIDPGVPSLGAPYVLMSTPRPAPHFICEVVDGVGVWVEPVDSREYKHFTGLAKLDLFTEVEQEAVIAMGLSGDVQVKRFYDRLIVADYLTYSDPQVELGLEMLVTRELLTDERKAAIVGVMTASRQ